MDFLSKASNFQLEGIYSRKWLIIATSRARRIILLGATLRTFGSHGCIILFQYNAMERNGQCEDEQTLIRDLPDPNVAFHQGKRTQCTFGSTILFRTGFCLLLDCKNRDFFWQNRVTYCDKNAVSFEKLIITHRTRYGFFLSKFSSKVQYSGKKSARQHCNKFITCMLLNRVV